MRGLTKSLRFRVFERDRFTCRYCGATAPLVVDHVVPVADGGGNGIDNLVTACQPCNQGKGAKTLREIPPPVAHPYPTGCLFLDDAGRQGIVEDVRGNDVWVRLFATWDHGALGRVQALPCDGWQGWQLFDDYATFLYAGDEWIYRAAGRAGVWCSSPNDASARDERARKVRQYSGARA